jgi:Ca2+-dependent lipid-binding protein
LDYDQESLPIGHLGTVRITVVRGRGLRIEQQLFEVAIPDCYCIVKFGPDDFRTTTKYNTCSPTWEEHEDFPLQDHGQLVTLEVWDMNEEVIGNGIPLGSTKTTVGKLLMSGGSMELEVLKEGHSSGIFIALRCDMVA